MGAKDAFRESQRLAGGARHSDTLRVAARAGYAARGLVYAVLALIAWQIAGGGGSNSADQQGALQDIASHAFGRVVLAVLAITFAAQVVLQLLTMLAGPASSQVGEQWRRRLRAAGSAAVYALFLVTTVTVLVRGGGQSSDARQQSITARALDATGGRVLVVIAGAVVLGVGAYFIWMGATRSFEKHLDVGGMSESVRRFCRATGVAGQVARGAVFALAGGFLAGAAITSDPTRSKGLDATLRTLRDTAYGPWLLRAVAVGLLCFAGYALIEARYRRLPEP